MTMLIEEWQKEYNRVSPHSSSGYKPLAPETIIVYDTNLKGGPNYRGRSPAAILNVVTT